MAVDFANMSIRVDARAVERAGRDLREMAVDAGDAERAVDRMGAEVTDTGRQIDRAGAEAVDAGRQIDRMGAEAVDAGRQIDRMGAEAVDAGRQIDRLGAEATDTGRQIDRAGRSAETAGRRIDRAGGRMAGGFREAAASAGNLKAILVALATGATGAGFVRVADEMANVESKLRLVTGSTEELAERQQQLADIAERTRTDFAATVSTYSDLASSLKSAGVSSADTLRAVESLNKGFVISGATGVEAANALRQLGQAFSAGVLRGEEYNSVAEQGKRIQTAMADELGKTRGELRAMAADGKLTIDLVMRALINQAGAIDSEFGKMNTTIGQATTTAYNHFKRLVGVLDDIVGASDLVVGAIDEMGKTFKTTLGGISSEAGRAQMTLLAAEIAIVETKFWRIGEAVGEVMPDMGEAFDKFRSHASEVWGSLIDFMAAGWDSIIVKIPAGIRVMSAKLEALAEKGKLYGQILADAVTLQPGMSDAELDRRIQAIDATSKAAIDAAMEEQRHAENVFRLEEERITLLERGAAEAAAHRRAEAAANEELADSYDDVGNSMGGMYIEIAKGNQAASESREHLDAIAAASRVASHQQQFLGEETSRASGSMWDFARSSAAATHQQQFLKKRLSASEKALKDYADALDDAQANAGLMGDKLAIAHQKLDAGQIGFDAYRAALSGLGGKYGELEGLTTKWSNATVDAVVDAAFGAKTNFKDMVNSMLKDLARLSAKRAIEPLFDGFLAGFTKSDAGGSGLFDSIGAGISGAFGDITSGISTAFGFSAPRPLAPSGAGGFSAPPVGFVPSTTNNDNRSMSPVNVVVNVENTGGGGDEAERGDDLGRAISDQVRVTLARELQPGGMLAR